MAKSSPETRTARIRKTLDTAVLPSIRDLIRKRDEAQKAYQDAVALGRELRAEKTQLEGEIKALKEQQQAAMTRRHDEEVAALSEMIRKKSDRIAAITDWLPKIVGVGLAVQTVPAKEKQALDEAQKELSQAAGRIINGKIRDEQQQEVDLQVDLLSEMVRAYEQAVSEFCLEYRANINPLDLLFYPDFDIKFPARVMPASRRL